MIICIFSPHFAHRLLESEEDGNIVLPTGWVLGGLPLTDDVAHAVSDQVQRCYGCLLCVAGYIRRDHGEKCDKRCRTRLRHVVPDQTTDVVGFRECHNENDAEQCRDQATQTTQQSLVRNVAQIPIQQQGDDFNGAAGDTED